MQIETCHVEVRPSKVRTSGPAAGNGLFATATVDQGEVLYMRQRPLVSALHDAWLPELCSNCYSGKTEAAALGRDERAAFVVACTGCNKVKYCGKDCQRAAWKRHHKHECKILSMPSVPRLTVECRAALQLSFANRRPDATEQDKAGIARLFAAYEENNAIYKRDSMRGAGPSPLATERIVASDFMNTVERAKPTEPVKASRQNLNLTLAKVVNNAMDFSDVGLNPIGIALDPLPCAANHSCEPNITAEFDGPSMYIRARKPIKAGDELLLSYMDEDEPLAKRADYLQGRYFFRCSCPKCVREGKISASIDPIPVDPISRAQNVLMALENMATALPDDACLVLARKMSDLMRELQATGHAITEPSYAKLRNAYISTLSARQRNLDLLKHAIKRHYCIDPVVYAFAGSEVRVCNHWDLVRLIWHLSMMQESQEIRRLLTSGFDFVPPLWRHIRALHTTLMSTPGRSRLAMVVAGHMAQIGNEIAQGNPERLRLIERDPDGHCITFERWKDDIAF